MSRKGDRIRYFFKAFLSRGRKPEAGCPIFGFTLIELLISVAVLGVIMLAMYQAVGSSVTAYSSTRGRQDLVSAARFAMERMVMFVEETDLIAEPDTATAESRLRISERVLDTYNNTTHEYDAAGDGIPDADFDADGLVNAGGSDAYDYVTFDLDESDAGNKKLRETLPDYSSSSQGNNLSPRVICEHVTLFQCSRISGDVVQIELTVSDGRGEVALKTRARARRINK
ncbi:MAG: prepilin-type N-terminal cleavage/methylation domain-containing protein [Syntrophales bacterium]|nr:prepilin-type N-terminal cleavage/methylation domain-containing protein [Syntrophales bacterium]MDD5532948.1 prepilin-type N-terminal cleavage/methylation domain-containing protein [Syntrophales bacterium]